MTSTLFPIVPMMSLSHVIIVLFLHEECVHWQRRGHDGRRRTIRDENVHHSGDSLAHRCALRNMIGDLEVAQMISFGLAAATAQMTAEQEILGKEGVPWGESDSPCPNARLMRDIKVWVRM
jgi:hypothetical protein